MNPADIPLLELSGRPYDMGLEHGLRFADAIRRFADERVRLAGDPTWSGRSLSRSDVLALANACLAEHRRYAPELVEELSGMADATGLTLPELIVSGGFTDFIDTAYGAKRAQTPAPAAADNCTAFIVPDVRAENGQGFFGQTWDMHASACEHVLLLRGRPQGKPAFLTFTTAGCLGMIGMNEVGICVGINNLLGGDGQAGVTWPFVVRKVLEQETIEAALACVTEARLAGAHNYLLFDAHGRGYNVEATSSAHEVSELSSDALVHTNHCLAERTRAVERTREPDSQASSEARLNRALELLDRDGITAEDLMALTRDESAICVRPQGAKEIATCGAALMRPKTLEFWAVRGLPSENAYAHFSLAG